MDWYNFRGNFEDTNAPARLHARMMCRILCIVFWSPAHVVSVQCLEWQCGRLTTSRILSNLARHGTPLFRRPFIFQAMDLNAACVLCRRGQFLFFSWVCRNNYKPRAELQRTEKTRNGQFLLKRSWSINTGRPGKVLVVHCLGSIFFSSLTTLAL